MTDPWAAPGGQPSERPPLPPVAPVGADAFAVSPGWEPTPVPQSPPRARRLGGGLMLIGGALAVVASTLPWVKASVGSFGSFSASGTDGGRDGSITIVLGLVLLGLGGWRLGVPRQIVAIPVIGTIASVLVAAVAIADLSDVRSAGGQLGGLGESLGFHVEAGIGLWLELVAAVIGLVGSVLVGVLRAGPAPQPGH